MTADIGNKVKFSGYWDLKEEYNNACIELSFPFIYLKFVAEGHKTIKCKNTHTKLTC